MFALTVVAILGWTDGTLVIVGGGGTPPHAIEAFISAAGAAKARLVVIPTASVTAETSSKEVLTREWREYQPASVEVLHTKSRKTANDPDFIKPLKSATGVWIGGGDQSRVTAAYLATPVERELMALFKRGGVIGGTSAGAAVMSKVMIAGGKDSPRLKTGFDLLADSIIDQHFSQRERLPRLLKAVQRNPDRFGLGIDERTAVVVKKNNLKVVGRGTITMIFDDSVPQKKNRLILRAGEQIDLEEVRSSLKTRASVAVPK